MGVFGTHSMALLVNGGGRVSGIDIQAVPKRGLYEPSFAGQLYP